MNNNNLMETFYLETPSLERKNEIIDYINEFVEHKSQYIVLIFIRFNFGTHLVCGSPYFLSKLLLIHPVNPSFFFFKGDILPHCYDTTISVP